MNTTDILTFMNANNLSYRCMWYYIRTDDKKKMPIYEKNNINLEEALNTRWWSKTKPELEKIKTIANHKNITDEEYKNLIPSYSLYIKHTELLFVIDVDVYGINSMDDFIQQTGITMFKNTAWTTGNRKGLHIYVYIKNMIEYTNQQKVFKAFEGDFLRTNNVWVMRNKIVNNYDIQTFEWSNIEPIVDVPKLNPNDKINLAKLTTKKIRVVNDTDTDVESVSTDATTSNTSVNIEEICNTIREFVKAIIEVDITYFDNYPEWILLGFVIFNETNGSEDGADLFVELTGLFNTTDPNRQQRTKSAIYAQYHATQPNRKKDKKLFMGSLYSWLEKVNPTSPLLKKSKNDDDITACSADYDFAVYFNKKWGRKFKSISQTKTRYYYEFNDKNLWVNNPTGSSIRNIISNEMVEELKIKINILKEDLKMFKPDDDRRKDIQQDIKELSTLERKFKSTHDKNNILREISDIIEDNEFEETLNKQKYILPLKNKRIIDMNTLETRERTIHDKFTYECGADYIDMTKEQEQEAKDYFMSLFCGNEDTMKCVLNIIKSCFTGVPLRYLFVATGSGRNGKSLLFKLLNIMFKKGMDIISKDVILEKKSNSNLNTEMEKLDKCRVGYVSELKQTDKLNETNIKEITGGDPINLRTIQKTDATLIATCCLWILTNELPSFNVEPAIMDRLIIIPFNNKFEINPNYETEMIEKVDLLFSFIMKHGVIQYEFNLTEEMKQSKSDYEEDNAKDYLGDFISDYIVKNTPKSMKRDEFRSLYNDYCAKNKYRLDHSTHASFVRKIQKNYGIEYDKNNKRFLNIQYCYNKYGDDDEIEKSG